MAGYHFAPWDGKSNTPLWVSMVYLTFSKYCTVQGGAVISPCDIYSEDENLVAIFKLPRRIGV